MVYNGARLQMFSFLGLGDCSCGIEGRQCHFASNESTGHDFDAADPSSGSALPQNDDDATIIDVASPVPSRWSDAETIRENPPLYRELENWSHRKHRTSARSYQELWPSSPTSLAHTMPTASAFVHGNQSSTHASPRKKRASCPQPRDRAARISPPILDASSVDAANWPGLVPYCPHREVPTPNKQTNQSKFDAYSDEEEDVSDGNDRRERKTLGRFRRRVSNSFQTLLCRGG
ncbi:hypothetical protein MMC07_007564 [Pseudocyphellaria aurata]|nr:hypothetical protein [Pseudocyphellaria aurata]